MKALLQRVEEASVSIEGQVAGKIGSGLVVLLGVAQGDSEADAEVLARKTAQLRIFSDEAGRFNLSVRDVKGEALVVSQFTLLADASKGRRPSFFQAAPPEVAQPLVDRFVELLQAEGIPVATGRFGAHMLVKISNDGPVTIILDSRDYL